VRRRRSRAGTYLGVDIGSAWIKAVELASGRGGLSVRTRVRVPTPPGTVQAGRISAPGVVGRALRQALGHAGVRTRRVVASVSGQVALVREVRLPHLAGDELHEAARFEVMRYLPYPITEATYDAFVLDEVQDNGATRMEVLVAAARTDLLAQHVETLRAAGLEPFVIDVEPFALLRAMVSADALEGRAALYIHIGATHTELLIVDGTAPRVIRTVVVGGNLITQRLAERKGVSLEDAETLKLRLSAQHVPDRDAKALEEIMRDALGDLTVEARRSLDYYQGRSRGAVPDHAVITGGGAALPGLSRLLATELDVPVQIGDPFRGLAGVPQRVGAAAPSEQDSALAVAVGLAERGAEEP